ncbi:TPA: hypothetical protein NEW56_001358 [Acinetobacter baumannii]|nr:hypothetical protein [Acinetobacter baumannii]
MKPEQFIREFGVEKARELLNADSDFKTYCLIDKSFWSESEGACSFCVDLDGVKHLVESFDLIEKLGGYGKCKFYMTGMKLNKCDSVKCPKTGLIVSRAALEIAINDYRKSIYGGGDE